MKRRDFLQVSTLAGISLTFSSTSVLSSCLHNKNTVHSAEYKKLVFELLMDWCDGMIKIQVVKPSYPNVHGMLECPSCSNVHTRLMDAVYPFLYMAKVTEDHKYLDAGIALMEWGDNVSRPDGAWG
ncbi:MULTISPECIES: hypothetical protein [unclassified Saccharicrinis]|uniref:hypothetical protein n=1 Tax=unclassified Saccharicrinis TaxID=2646859 RepID=UPI003D359465